MAKSKRYSLGTFTKEFTNKPNAESIWQIYGGQAGLSARNVTVVMLACCLMAGINVRAAAVRPQ